MSENPHDPTSDESLYRHYCQGNMQAFEQLYQRYRASLYRYLLRTSYSAAEGEEIYQEVWSRVISHPDGFQEGNFRAYLFRIARNLQIDWGRKNRLHLVADEGEAEAQADPRPDQERQQHMRDCAERLQSEVGALPGEQREAFLLKEEGGLSLEQIATLVQVGRETIKSRLRYAMKTLRKALEDCL